MAVVSGVVRNSAGDLGAFLVRVFRSDTGALVANTTSNASTGAWSVTVPNAVTTYFATAHYYKQNGNISALRLSSSFNGVNGAAAYDDLDSSAWTNVGTGVTLSTTQKPFSEYNTSAYFSGTGTISRADSSNWNLNGSGTNATIRMRYYRTGGGAGLLSHRTSAIDGWAITTSSLRGIWNGSFVDPALTWTDPGTGVWVLFELVKSGNTVYIFHDGAATTSFTAANVGDSSGVLNLGSNNASTENAFTGYIADFEYYQGLALHTSAYTDENVPCLGSYSKTPNYNALIYDALVSG